MLALLLPFDGQAQNALRLATTADECDTGTEFWQSPAHQADTFMLSKRLQTKMIYIPQNEAIALFGQPPMPPQSLNPAFQSNREWQQAVGNFSFYISKRLQHNSNPTEKIHFERGNWWNFNRIELPHPGLIFLGSSWAAPSRFPTPSLADNPAISGQHRQPHPLQNAENGPIDQHPRITAEEILPDLSSPIHLSLPLISNQNTIANTIPFRNCTPIPSEQQPPGPDITEFQMTTNPQSIGTAVKTGIINTLPDFAENEVIQNTLSGPGQECSVNFTDGEELSAYTPKKYQEKKLELLKNFMKSCVNHIIIPSTLTKPSENDPDESSVSFSDTKVRIYNQIINFNVSEHANANCHGLLTRNDNAQLILATARHCLKPEDGQPAIRFSEIGAHNLAGTQLTLKLCKKEQMIIDSAIPTIQEGMAICVQELIRISDNSPIGDRIKHVPTSQKIETGDKLILASRISFIAQMHLLEDIIKDKEIQRKYSFAEMDSTICRIFAVSGPLIIHNCQSTPGTSGAPIFKTTTNSNGRKTIEFVGIHVGFTKHMLGLSYFADRLMRNVGISLHRLPT